MYNIKILDGDEKDILGRFGEKYDPADEVDPANALIVGKTEVSPVMLSDKLLFAVTMLSPDQSDNVPLDLCSFSGIAVFQNDDIDESVKRTRDFIENGNIGSSVNYPDVSLGPFGDEAARIAVSMYRIEEPILMAYMMFSSLDIKAVAGGRMGDHSYALVAARKPVSQVPKVEGVVKVRVLQDI